MRVRRSVSSGGGSGLTLVELLIALGLATLVLALVGTIFVASLSAWQRGRDLSDAQANAAILTETIARDIRRASQAPGVTIHPAVPLADGVPILSLALMEDETGAARWVIYAQRTERRDVVRLSAEPSTDGHLFVTQARVVAVGVERVTARLSGHGVTVEAVTRRGRGTGLSRATAVPMNP
jgi:type II secretory pathway pseudopilin PulG